MKSKLLYDNTSGFPDDTSITGFEFQTWGSIFPANISQFNGPNKYTLDMEIFWSAPHQIKNIGHYRRWKATTGDTIKSVVPVYRFELKYKVVNTFEQNGRKNWTNLLNFSSKSEAANEL